MHWLSEHPDALLVTDVKEGNLEALRHISANYPQFLSRIVPQIYQPTEYSVVQDLGFERIIWTLYMYSGGSLAVLDAVQVPLKAGAKPVRFFGGRPGASTFGASRTACHCLVLSVFTCTALGGNSWVVGEWDRPMGDNQRIRTPHRW